MISIEAQHASRSGGFCVDCFYSRFLSCRHFLWLGAFTVLCVAVLLAWLFVIRLHQIKQQNWATLESPAEFVKVPIAELGTCKRPNTTYVTYMSNQSHLRSLKGTESCERGSTMTSALRTAPDSDEGEWYSVGPASSASRLSCFD